MLQRHYSVADDRVLFLNLRHIGKRTGFEGKASSQLREVIKNVNTENLSKINNNDEPAKKQFLNEVDSI